jgi:hypothetical protein
MDQLRAAVFTAVLAGRDPGSLLPELCDLDHTRPYDQVGATCECNLEPASKR